MKRLILVVLLLSMAAGFAAAQSQWDLSLQVPYYFGARGSDSELGEFAMYAFLIPDVKWHYYFGPEFIRFGAGIKMWSLILESAIYPIVSLESHLGDFVLNAGVGGGAFLFFGLANNATLQPVFLPEVSVAYRLGQKKRFSIGTGATFLFAPEVVGFEEFIFMGTAFVRWTF